MARAGTPPLYLIQREIYPDKPVSLERYDIEEQQENSVKQDEEGDRILEYNSPSDDADIPSLEREADFHHGRGSRFEKYSLQQQNYGTMGLPSSPTISLFLIVDRLLGTNFFSPQPSAAIKIKDGHHNFR